MKSDRPGVRARLMAVIAVLALGFPSSCAINPVSGRPEAVATTEEGEIEQGREAAKAVEEQIGLVDDPELAAYVDEIGQRLARHSPRENLEHTFQVVEMLEPNAFALPGGHIYVSRGLLALLNSEDELACVLGHEIGHVAARHSVSRQAANVPLIPVRLATGIGAAAAGIVSPRLGRLIAGVGQMPGAFAIAKYSRDQERESDRIGQDYANAEGFDPHALSSFMQTLAREVELQGHDPDRISFFDSHPSSPERALASSEYAASLARPEKPGPVREHSAFLAEIEGIVVGDGAAEGVFIDERFLQPELGFGLHMPSGWQTANTPNAVIAQRKDERAQLVVEIVAQGDDPLAGPEASAGRVRLDGPPRSITINGLRAAEAVADLGRGRDSARLHLTWIAHGGLIYQISGASLPADFDAALPRFAATANSFHELGETERSEIREQRLRLTRSVAGEDLATLKERSGSEWSVEQTAVANGLETAATLTSEALIKIAKAEPYQPKPKSQAVASGS